MSRVNDFQKLDSVLNTEFVEEKPLAETEEVSEGELVEVCNKEGIYDKIGDEVKKDYDFVRKNYYEMIGETQKTLKDMLQIAKMSDEAEDYDTVNSLLNTLANQNEKLINIHRKTLDVLDRTEVMDNEPVPESVTNIYMTTDEVIKMLKSDPPEEK